MQNKDWQMYKCRNETLFPLVVPHIVTDWQAADPLPSPHSVSELFCFLFLRFCLFCSTYCQHNLWNKHTTPYFAWNASSKRNEKKWFLIGHPDFFLSHCYLCYHFDKDKVIIVGEITDLQHKIWDEAAREEIFRRVIRHPALPQPLVHFFTNPLKLVPLTSSNPQFHGLNLTCI